MSLGPVQTGSAGPGTTSTVTGLDGPSRARSTEAATAPSRRATMTSPRGRPPSVTRPRPASSVSRAVSRTWAPGAGDRGEQAARVAGAQEVEVVEDLLGELGRGHAAAAATPVPPPGAGPRPAAAPGCRRAPGRRGRRWCTAARSPPRRRSAGCGGCPGRPGSPAAEGRAPAVPLVVVAGHARTIPSTWSRSSVIRASSGASTFSRSSGSVLLARRLNHAPSGSSTVRPSSSSTPRRPARRRSSAHLGHPRRRRRRRWS